jgi:hypothetical protein
MITDHNLAHLKEQFSRARPILFIGAGFSKGVKNIIGGEIPLAYELKEKLWAMCFPDTPFEPSSSLQDVFESSRMRNVGGLQKLLTESLTIDQGKVPVQFQEIFSMPWHRCYTLNIDNLEKAVESHYDLPRPVIAISATSTALPASYESPMNQLQVIHLNGTLADIPDQITFSVTQYAERISRQEPWYVQLASDLLVHPILFVGTEIDEPPLWQHVLLRKMRGSGRELRPRSYLVKPSLNEARKVYLSQFNVQWIPASREDFFTKLLIETKESCVRGQAFLSEYYKDLEKSKKLREVAELAITPNQKTEFLLGQEPQWSDIQSNRAIEREIDTNILAEAKAILSEKGKKKILIITGTAGSGKSTTAMRLGLALTAEGNRVGWSDINHNLPPFDLRRSMSASAAPFILIMDDADIYGPELANIVRDLVSLDNHPFIVVALREVRLDKCLNPIQLKECPSFEIAIPPLADSDISKLIDVLTREHRLGVLKEKPRQYQEAMFKQHAGRQLLVAMIEATSGLKFFDKVFDEYDKLGENNNKIIYGLICVATYFRYALSKTDILIAVGDSSNEYLNSVDTLVNRHVIINVAGDRVMARHRVIAEIVFERLRNTGQLLQLLEGLAVAAATQCGKDTSRKSKEFRLLKSVINHDLLIKCSDVENARNVYSGLERLLHEQSHFWLQRGSLEVEEGNLQLAENFLNQAMGLSPDDNLIASEYAYLLFLKAIENYSNPESTEYVSRATVMLRQNINIRGKVDPYPYHIFGRQGLVWCRKGIAKRNDKAAYIDELKAVVEQGLYNHPKDMHLLNLKKELHDEYLSLALS